MPRRTASPSRRIDGAFSNPHFIRHFGRVDGNPRSLTTFGLGTGSRLGSKDLSSETGYNVKRDRVAAEIVFQSGVPITAVGLDVTSKLNLREKDLDRMRLSNDPAGNFLVRLVDLVEQETHNPNPTLYDPLTIAAIFRPDVLVMQTGTVNIPLSGPGQTVFKPAESSKTQVAVTVNAAAFLDLFVDRVTRGLGGLR